MANTKLGNIARNDAVVFKDELDSDPPVDKDDINATGAGASKILAINAGNTALEWIAQTGSGTSFAALTDTDITTPADGAVAIYDTGTATWRDNVLSGDVTMDDSGVVAIANGSITTAMLDTGNSELGSRLLRVAVTAAPGGEVADEILVSYGFQLLNGATIDFSVGYGGVVPYCTFIVSDTINGPKRSSSAYVSSVTQGIVVDGLNTAECVILGTEPSSGTHITFKVKFTGVGAKYIWVKNSGGYWYICQAEKTPQTITFA